MRGIFKNRLVSAFPVGICLFIAFSGFVPPSLKEKGDRGKGSLARNLPTSATRIPERGMRKVFLGEQMFYLKTPPPVPLPFQGRGYAKNELILQKSDF